MTDKRIPPLLVTADMALVDQIVRVAADVSVPLLVVGSTRQARHWWQVAPLVLLGADVARSVERTPRLAADRLLLVTTDGGLDLSVTASALAVSYFAILPHAAPWLGERLRASVLAAAR